MADSTADLAVPRCPWCSAELPSGTGDTCPSCGATLTSDAEPQLPGLTAIDHEGVFRRARMPTSPKRNRLLSWISGDDNEEPLTAVKPDAVALPPIEVRREMLRMEIAAEMSERAAEAGSIAIDEAEASGDDAALATAVRNETEAALAVDQITAAPAQAPLSDVPVEVDTPSAEAEPAMTDAGVSASAESRPRLPRIRRPRR
jgi:hypothetical protein